MDGQTYENPLITRYASTQMAQNFSDMRKFSLWRKLWIALAESEMELGLNITSEQIAEMKKYEHDINLKEAAKREKEVRHDVMAHVYAFGLQAKSAKPIIHLGATSCYVTDNADILMFLDAIRLIKDKLAAIIARLKDFCIEFAALPVLGYTHFQPAQLTTVGKRASLWLQDLVLDYAAIEHLNSVIKLRGAKGTTGTQASFLSLFDGDEKKVKQLDDLVCGKLGGMKSFGVTGQTYPRKIDYNILSALSQIAQSAHKFAEDLRLLQHLKEIEEPFEKDQIGSSAMAYKRNPMRSERICSLSRFVTSLPINQAVTASTQWFERTLDDSANRRVVMPQAFLAVDGILKLYLNIMDGLTVNKKVIEKHINEELPFMATENIIMECVKNGGDRQDLHECIRVHSMESAKRVKDFGLNNDLIDKIKADPHFSSVKNSLDTILNPANFIGCAESQVYDFIANEVDPILLKSDVKQIESDINV